MINLAHNLLLNEKIIHVNVMSCFVNNIITDGIKKIKEIRVKINEHAFTSPETT